MYREQFLHYAKENAYVRPAPGAESVAIQRAEQQLGCTLPEALRQLFLEADGDGYLFLSLDRMLATIANLRGMLAEDYAGVEQLLFFAANGCGDYYCYRILPTGQVDASTIYFWLHEDNELVPVAQSLTEFIDRYFQDEI